MEPLLLELLTAVVVVYLLLKVKSARDRLKHSIASFGDAGRRPISDQIRITLARQYMRQQAIAFGLVVTAIIVGLVFSSSLMYRVVFAPDLRLADVGRAAALAGDIFIGRYAFRSYREASERAEKLIVSE